MSKKFEMRRLAVPLLLCVMGWVPSAHAVPMMPGDVPADRTVTIDGLEWVWASPCEGNGSGCAEAVTLHDDWRFPTTFEYNNLIGAAVAALAGAGKCGAPWFQGNWSHCDFGDRLWRADDPATDRTFGDTLLVRGEAVPPVPEPASVALILLGLAGLGTTGRRRS